jgi:hypothetical protein
LLSRLPLLLPSPLFFLLKALLALPLYLLRICTLFQLSLFIFKLALTIFPGLLFLAFSLFRIAALLLPAFVIELPVNRA